MYDGAMRRNLAAQDRIKPVEQPSVKPTPVNRRALEGRNFVENVIAVGRKDYQNGKRSPVLMAGQRRTPKLSADARMWRRQYQNDKTQREALQDAAISVWQGDPKHPMKECRRLLNLARNIRKEILQPIVDNMTEQGIKQGVEFIPIEDRRMMRESHNAMWYRNYYKENKKAPSQTAMYDIAEDIFLGRGDKYSVGYYSGIDGKGLQQIAKDNHAELDYINNAIEAYETLELKLKENPNYGKEWATGEKAAEETGATKTPRNSEAAEVKAEPTTKSDKDEVNKKAPALAEGYATESGKSLAEADVNEFVLHNGEKNFGEISNEISEASGGELSPGYIRLKVGDNNKGLIHAKKHESQAIETGYKSIEDMIYDVCQNFTDIYKQEPKTKGYRSTYVLVKRGSKSKLNATSPVYFEMQADGKGGYYVVVTAIPKSEKSLQRQTKKEALLYSRPGIDSAATSNGSAVSNQGNNNVGVAQSVLPTSDTTSASVNSSVAQEQENVKKILLPKGVTAEVKLNDKLNGVEVKFSDKPGPKVAKSMRDAGYTWSSNKQLWYSKQNNAESMAMAEKLGYKPAEKVE